MSLVFENTKLSSTEKLVMLALADHANDEGKSVYPSQERLSRKTGLARETINRYINKLSKNGYLYQVGYRQDRNNVLEVEISIKRLAEAGVTENHTHRCDGESQGGVTENHIKHHSNHHLKESTEDLENEFISFFTEKTGVTSPQYPNQLSSWYTQVGEWVEMNVTKQEVLNAIKVADKKKMTISRPGSLTNFIRGERGKAKRGVSNDVAEPQRNVIWAHEEADV